MVIVTNFLWIEQWTANLENQKNGKNFKKVRKQQEDCTFYLQQLEMFKITNALSKKGTNSPLLKIKTKFYNISKLETLLCII